MQRLEQSSLALRPILDVQASLTPDEAKELSLIVQFWNRSTSSALGSIVASIRTLKDQELRDLSGAIVRFYGAALRERFWDRPRDPREA